MPDFDLTRYSGRWYELIRDKSTPFELFTNCVMAEYYDYTDSDDPSIITVTNSAVS